jgi:hypothetical protein
MTKQYKFIAVPFYNFNPRVMFIASSYVDAYKYVKDNMEFPNDYVVIREKYAKTKHRKICRS